MIQNVLKLNSTKFAVTPSGLRQGPVLIQGGSIFFFGHNGIFRFRMPFFMQPFILLLISERSEYRLETEAEKRKNQQSFLFHDLHDAGADAAAALRGLKLCGRSGAH
ncbi:hypothetical protein D3C75_785150 [compost metagenome]